MGELTAAVADDADPAEVAEALSELESEQGLRADDPDLFVGEDS